MKTIFKILVILVVAALIGGLFYGVVTATSSGTSQSSLSERPSPVDREFASPDRGDDTGGIQFPADAVKNLMIISVVSIIYLNASKWLNKKKSIVNVTS
jgi:hypothetical protein